MRRRVKPLLGRRLPFFFFFFLFLFACSSGDARPTASGVEGVAVGTVRFRLTNTTATPLYAARSVTNGALRQLEIDGLTFAPSPSVTDLCGGDGTHDDPFFDTEAVNPSESIEYTWGERTHGAAAIVRDESRNCSQIVFARAGSYSARACLLAKSPDNPNGNLDAVPHTCVDVTAVVPAAGETLVTLLF